MIGSHNTMTYLRARKRAWELLRGWWRCQDKTLEEQIKEGVRWFDLRVARRVTAAGDKWYWAHGSVDLGKEEADIEKVLDTIGECGGTCRMMLERGDDADEAAFIRRFCRASYLQSYSQITAVVIKKQWKPLWYGKGYFPMTDMSWVPYHRDKPWWKQIKSMLAFPFSTIKCWALRHTRPRESDKNNRRWIWVYDYV